MLTRSPSNLGVPSLTTSHISGDSIHAMARIPWQRRAREAGAKLVGFTIQKRANLLW